MPHRGAARQSRIPLPGEKIPAVSRAAEIEVGGQRSARGLQLERADVDPRARHARKRRPARSNSGAPSTPGTSAGSPASIAGLPGSSACVIVGPPLSASGPSIGSTPTRSPRGAESRYPRSRPDEVVAARNESARRPSIPKQVADGVAGHNAGGHVRYRPRIVDRDYAYSV